ncbi:MAG: Exodeoxyribonuclease 7 small subunit [Chlamydiae bacterium]|nr:Exodeoxyribonuclease 7 small subunit [Chlamydiota bacterium]
MQNLNFEQSFEKLEDILKKMNSGELPLDRSLEYYEEADKLIQTCQKHLKKAEKRIEILMKNRDNDIQIDENGDPQTAPFDPTALKHENP